MKGENDLSLQEIRAPYELVKQVAQEKRLPVVNFAAGGVATPADAALMMQLGACVRAWVLLLLHDAHVEEI
jgi:pyridoxal biosynthesis lyase PdxS